MLLQMYLAVSRYLTTYLTSCSFTDKVYKEIGLLSNLTFLDLCGAQVTIIVFNLNYQAICFCS